MSFHKTLTEDRRLSLLLMLAETPGYRANAFLLRDAIAEVYGHDASIDQVKTDVAWLAEQGLVSQTITGEVVMAALTARGVDAAAGRATVPGVKRPMP